MGEEKRETRKCWVVHDLFDSVMIPDIGRSFFLVSFFYI